MREKGKLGLICGIISKMSKVLELADTKEYTMAEIGQLCGITRQRVHQVIKANGRDGRARQKQEREYKKRIYGEAVRQVRELYLNGMALTQAYQEVGITAYICKMLWTVSDEDKQAHLIAKLLSRTEVGEVPLGFDEPCRHWKGYMYEGTPIFAHTRNSERRAHYLLYTWTRGEKPPRGAKQLCGNTDCVEPSHLG